MNLKPIIREYNNSTDKDSLRDVLRHNKEHVPQNIQSEEYLLKLAQENKTYVLDHIENEVITAAAFLIADTKDLGYIKLVVVDPRFTRKHNQQSYSYGTQILTHVIKDLRDNHQCTKIILDTDIHNTPANQLFIKLGFTLLMNYEGSNYYELCGHVLEKF
jgi:ribosomal protein S18 acetylase RimI-like enzyme